MRVQVILGVLKDNSWVHKCTQALISSIKLLKKIFVSKDGTEYVHHDHNENVLLMKI